MNKLNKLFLVIIIILTVSLGVMTYYYFHMRNAYIGSAERMVEIIELLEEKGISIYGDETNVEIKENN